MIENRENHKKQQKNSCREASQSMKNQWVMVLFIGILMIFIMANISAANIKSYNTQSKTINIKSHNFIDVFGWFDSPILNATLDTPQVYHVGLGYQKVAQFTIRPNQNVSDVIQGFQLYDLNKNNEQITRQIDVKYLTYENLDVPDYTNKITGYSANGTAVYSQVQTGSHTEKKKVWKDFNNFIKTNGVVTIGIFTDVQANDKVEWIPTIANVKINEWATWTADLNVGLKSYYKLDE